MPCRRVGRTIARMSMRRWPRYAVSIPLFIIRGSAIGAHALDRTSTRPSTSGCTASRADSRIAKSSTARCLRPWRASSPGVLGDRLGRHPGEAQARLSPGLLRDIAAGGHGRASCCRRPFHLDFLVVFSFCCGGSSLGDGCSAAWAALVVRAFCEPMPHGGIGANTAQRQST